MNDKGIEELGVCNVYYAYSYCSYERGSNENANRFIRRFIPKSFKYLNECDLSIIEIDLLKDIVFTNIKKLVMELLSKNINNSIDDIKDI